MVDFNPTLRIHRQAELYKIETSLIYRVPGQLRLHGKTVSKPK